MKRQIRIWASLLGLWLSNIHAGTIYYDYTDPEGNVLAVADAQGNVVARYDYAPYGQPVASLGNPPDGPGYTGHVNDPETGLIYMQARYYLQAGRFPSPDPVAPTPGDLFSFNRYVYANNNPVTHTDPTGRSVTCDANSCTISDGDNLIQLTADALTVGVIYTQRLVQNAMSRAQSTTQESRSKPPPPLPEAGGLPHSIPDGKGGYTTYPSGKSTEGKQYRPTGKSHGDIPRPNIKEWKPNIAPDGTEYPSKGEVRPPEPHEVPSQPQQTPLPETEEGS